ncbi:MAG: FAD binding domain-containing protein [Candidatus Obscuribacterales bacterium]|nr:FAD binding domain-containing protein [Candidatus Obscuribacterales bacterium]
MRDYLLFYVNGKEYRVSGQDAFQPLSSFLRYKLDATGTKVVCEEGDCGACTILSGRIKDGELQYKPVNSCIQYLYQLDLAHIVTVEGLTPKGELNPVQQAMVNCHGAQCGYCTPGFIVAMCGLFDKQKKASECQIKDALIGNLCRCTGYDSIIKAGLAVEVDKVLSLKQLYPSQAILSQFAAHKKESVCIKAEGKTVFLPSSIKDAISFKAENKEAVIVSGGTDMCVNMNKRAYDPQTIISFCNIEGLSEIKIEKNILAVGSRITLSELEEFIKDRLPEFHHLLWLFGSPQIRHAGTLAGNIANASPIADTPPFLFVMEAQLELSGSSGTRTVPINQFYLGYKKLDLKADEIITRILIPLPEKQEIIRLYKVSKRKNLDISTNTAAIRATIKNGKTEKIAIAYGGVGPVVFRLPKTEAYLTGKELSLPNLVEAGEIAVSEITPISDVRGSKEFRNLLAKNILLKFFYDTDEAREAACHK